MYTNAAQSKLNLLKAKILPETASIPLILLVYRRVSASATSSCTIKTIREMEAPAASKKKKIQ